MENGLKPNNVSRNPCDVKIKARKTRHYTEASEDTEAFKSKGNTKPKQAEECGVCGVTLDSAVCDEYSHNSHCVSVKTRVAATLIFHLKQYRQRGSQTNNLSSRPPHPSRRCAAAIFKENKKIHQSHLIMKTGNKHT
jgi:hypothetical protein